MVEVSKKTVKEIAEIYNLKQNYIGIQLSRAEFDKYLVPYSYPTKFVFNEDFKQALDKWLRFRGMI